MSNEKILDGEKLKAILTSVYQKDEQGESLENIMNDLKRELSQAVKQDNLDVRPGTFSHF
ncbi:bacteriocin immunity protein [Paraliobacillus salinarum]|uniref:bacteriocin immunity protein n=1 Tax=Paraliobacillus salinarum TaxID=1158996 RepID=UPI0015F4DFCA|nr:bacteriocin immunity protein [Paraliobacillus salinarum]